MKLIKNDKVRAGMTDPAANLSVIGFFQIAEETVSELMGKLTLGYLVDSSSVSEYGKEKFAVLVLWDMTWFGYDDEKIQAEVMSWKDETNFISYDEIKELLKP